MARRRNVRCGSESFTVKMAVKMAVDTRLGEEYGLGAMAE